MRRRVHLVVGRARCGAPSWSPAARRLVRAASRSRRRPGRSSWRRCGAIQCATLSVPLDWSRPHGRKIALRARAPAPADGQPDRRAAREPRRSRRVRHRARAQAAGVVRRSACSTGSTSCRGIRAASARARRSAAPTISTSSTRSTATATDAATARANVAAARRLVAGCARTESGACSRTSRRARTGRDMDAIRAAMGERDGQLPRVLVRHVSRRAVRRARIPTGSARWCSTARSIRPRRTPTASITPGGRLRATRSTRSCVWCRDDTRVRVRPLAATRRPRSTTCMTTLDERDGSRPRWTASSASLGIGEANIGDRDRALRRERLHRVGGARQGAERRRPRRRLALLALVRRVHRPAARRHLRQRDRRVLRDRLSRRPGRHDASRPCSGWPARGAGPPRTSAARPCGSGCRARSGRSAGGGRRRRFPTRRAPPLVVIGTTDDPATPFSAARVARARALDVGHLLTYVGEGHTAYGRGDECVDRPSIAT